MKTFFAKINSTWEESECVTDVGEIISMTDWSMDDYGGHANFKTTDIEFVAGAKPNVVLSCGCTCSLKEDGEFFFISDPRVLMMYMWKLRQELFNEPITEPPIPTREEAIVWLKEMDIPLEPQERAREWTPKLKRNFLNIKD